MDFDFFEVLIFANSMFSFFEKLAFFVVNVPPK